MPQTAQEDRNMLMKMAEGKCKVGLNHCVHLGHPFGCLNFLSPAKWQ